MNVLNDDIMMLTKILNTMYKQSTNPETNSPWNAWNLTFGFRL